jgi:hypothetical protein
MTNTITLRNYRTYLMNKAFRELDWSLLEYAKTVSLKDLKVRFLTEKF